LFNFIKNNCKQLKYLNVNSNLISKNQIKNLLYKSDNIIFDN